MSAEEIGPMKLQQPTFWQGAKSNSKELVVSAFVVLEMGVLMTTKALRRHLIRRLMIHWRIYCLTSITQSQTTNL